MKPSITWAAIGVCLVIGAVVALKLGNNDAAPPSMTPVAQEPRDKLTSWATPQPASLKSLPKSASPAANVSTTSVAEQLNQFLTKDNGREYGPVTVRAWHQRLLNEMPDPNWSPYVEAAIRSYLTEKLDPSLVQIVQIQCGATLCEIQAAAASPTDNISEASDNFQQVAGLMARQPWWSAYNLDFPNSTLANGEGHQLLFVSDPLRNPNPQQ